jgi:hypothetical protein
VRRLETVIGALVVGAALLRRRPAGRLPSGVNAEDLAAGYERSDWQLGWIAFGGFGLLAVLGVVLLAVTWFAASSTGMPVTVGRPTDLVQRLEGAPTPPPPRLEVDESADLTAYRVAAQSRLHSYGWVDRASGVVSVPIERAKTLVVERGQP